MATKQSKAPPTPTVGFGEEPHHLSAEREGVAGRAPEPHQQIDERPGVAGPGSPHGRLAPPPATTEKIDTTPLRRRFAVKKEA